MISRENAFKIIDAALSSGGDFAEIYMERTVSNVISMDDGKIEDILYGTNQGAGIRVVDGEQTYFLNDNDISMENLIRTAEKLSKSVGKKKKTECGEFKDRNIETPCRVAIQPCEVNLETKIGKVITADRAARDFDKRVAQVRVNYGDTDKNVLVANSEGVFDTERRVRTQFIVQVVAKSGKQMYTGMDVKAESMGFELFDDRDADDIAEEAARIAVLQLDAKPAPAGTFTVVLSSKAGGTMIHEACGHGLEGDFIKDKVSVYADKVGQKVASGLITVIDDGLIPCKRGSEKMDDEGTPSSKVILIEEGILKGFLHDRKSAAENGMKKTGNGRRQSFRDLPIPRMRNTYIKPGKSDPSEIIKSVESGILVSRMGGGQVDIVNGNFVFQILEGYMIEAGKVCEPIKGATLTGNGPEVIKMIDMVGNDLGFAPGTCGKAGQGVPVSDAQPTIRIPRITVGGMVG